MSISPDEPVRGAGAEGCERGGDEVRGGRMRGDRGQEGGRSGEKGAASCHRRVRTAHRQAEIRPHGEAEDMSTVRR